MTTTKEAALDWAEENHITAIVAKPESNVLFAKKLAKEAFLAGAEFERKRIFEATNAYREARRHANFLYYEDIMDIICQPEEK